MGDAVALAGIYRRLIAARVRSQLEYRLSFTLMLIATGLVAFLDFVTILVIFNRVPALAGWSLHEVALLYGIASISFAFTDLVVGHLDLFPDMIRQGTFDLILIRPLPSLFQVVAADFTLRRLAKALQGMAVLLVAILGLEIDWTVGKVLMIVVAIVSGAVIYAAVWIALATIAFWIVDAIEVVNAFTYGGSFLANYPITIFGRWLRTLVLFVIPLAFVAYFPALYVLDKEDGLGLPGFLQFASPVVAVVAAGAAGGIWKYAVRHYRSAGG